MKEDFLMVSELWKKMGVPGLLCEILALTRIFDSKNGDFEKAHSPKEKIDDKEREQIIRDMLPFEQACYVLTCAYKETAKEKIDQGAQMDSEEVQSDLRKARETDNHMWYSIREQLEDFGCRRKIAVRADWKIVEITKFDGKCYCGNCNSRRSEIVTHPTTGLLVLK